MKQWKALLIDDELIARTELKRLLEKYEQINIIGEAGSVDESVDVINNTKPDLLFLDIDLGTLSGFDLLEKVECNFQIIFVTAFDEYAIRAFEVNALDYLLKPVNPLRLKDSIARLGNPHAETKQLFLKPFDKLLIKSMKASWFITVSSIESIEANGDYTIVRSASGKKGIVHQTIAKWVSRLPSEMFIQVHRSFIVNTDHIESLNRRDNGLIEIITKHNKKTIPVSRNFSRKFLSRYKI